jgi:hypothetical protein
MRAAPTSPAPRLITVNTFLNRVHSPLQDFAMHYLLGPRPGGRRVIRGGSLGNFFG